MTDGVGALRGATGHLARQTEVAYDDMSRQVRRDFLGFGYKDELGIAILCSRGAVTGRTGPPRDEFTALAT
jgi:hypothetical protein